MLFYGGPFRAKKEAFNSKAWQPGFSFLNLGDWVVSNVALQVVIFSSQTPNSLARIL